MPRTVALARSIRRLALAGAAAACVLMTVPSVPAVAAPPSGEKDGAGSAQRPSGPRRMGLGGTRARGGKKIQSLGGAKFPFRSLNDRSLKPRYSLPGRGGDRTFKTIVVPIRPVTGDGSATPVQPEPAPVFVPTGAVVRGALLSGSGVRNTAFERAVRLNISESGDIEVGPRIRVGPAHDAVREGSPAAALRDFVTRTSPAPGAAGLLAEVAAPTRGETALEIARRELGRQGYTEVELGRGDIGFIRTRNPAVIDAIQRKREQIRSIADGGERWYEWEVRRHLNRRYDPCADDDWRPNRVLGVMEGPGVDPQLQFGLGGAVSESEPLSEFDAALVAIERGRYAAAAAALREYLAGEPEDMEIVRLLGIVELLDGKIDRGIETLAKAYESDPYLAARPVGSEVLLDHPDSLRRAVGAAVGYAHRTRSPRAWLAAAVLMEAEGRRDQAAKMIDRAIEAGLDRSVADEMLLALRP